jgi:hypothetical protein
LRGLKAVELMGPFYRVKFMAQLDTGMAVRSIAGETGKTCEADDTFTGANVVGYIDSVIEGEDGKGPVYVVTFENDVTVKIDEDAIFDTTRYVILS